jgi:AraC-like DNA-binding protein
MIYIIGIAISFFLSVLLLLKKNKSTADKILAGWLSFIGLHLFLFYSFLTGKIYSWPWLLGIHFPFPLLHGPALYIYAAALTGNLNASNKKYLLHFIPAALCYVYLLHFFLLPSEEKINVFKNRGAGYETFNSVIVAAIIVSGIVYVILTLLLHWKHRRKIVNEFSNIERINLDWIQYLMYGIAIIWAFVIFGDDNLIFIAVVFYVLFMGFFGIRQTPVFMTHHQPETQPDSPVEKNLISEDARKNFGALEFSVPVTQTPAEKKLENIHEAEHAAEANGERSKYQKSGLDEEELQRIHGQLTALMEREKLYTNPELTLGEAAQQLNVHPNYLSQVINSVTKKNFYDYINSQRVEEFNRMVRNAKNQKFTLLSLAFECGFNSKTSFNRNFRKVTGLSPSQYLKQMNVNFDQVN